MNTTSGQNFTCAFAFEQSLNKNSLPAVGASVEQFYGDQPMIKPELFTSSQSSFAFSIKWLHFVVPYMTYL